MNFRIIIGVLLSVAIASAYDENCSCEARYGRSCLPDDQFNLSHGQVDSSTMSLLNLVFEERKTPNSLAIMESSNLHFLNSGGTVTLTFYHEGAGYRNVLGYVLFDEWDNIISEHPVFPDLSIGGGGCSEPGDTVTLGPFPQGTRLGWYIIANGFNNPSYHKYYTVSVHNPDGKPHVAYVEDSANGNLLIGFEDLFNLGDRDYNDAMFVAEVSPPTAVDTGSVVTSDEVLNVQCSAAVTPTETITRSGAVWSTLGNNNPALSHLTCYKEKESLPADYDVAAVNQATFSTVVRNAWAAERVVLGSGDAFTPMRLRQESENELVVDNEGCHSVSNPCYQSIPIVLPMPAFEDILDGACEAPSRPDEWYYHSHTTTTASDGYNSCRSHCISSSTGSVNMALSKHIVPTEGYKQGAMFSVWVKATEVTGGAAADFALYVDVEYEDGKSQYFISPLARGTYDWTWESLNVYSADQEIKNIYLHVTFRGDVEGSACVSAFHMAPPDPNIVANPSFNEANEVHQSWFSLSDSADTSGLHAEGLNLDSEHTWHYDEKSLCLGSEAGCGSSVTTNGLSTYGAQQFIYQDPRLDGCTAIRFGGFAKCDGCVAGEDFSGDDYSVYLDIYYQNDEYPANYAIAVPFDTSSSEWKLYQDVFYATTTVPIEKIVVTVLFRGVAGTAYVDRIFVDPFKAAGHVVATAWGDPHLITYDDYVYDMQAVGEFTLLRDTSATWPSQGYPFEVQVRTTGTGNLMASIVTDVAITALCTRIQFSATSGDNAPDILAHGSKIAGFGEGKSAVVRGSCPDHDGVLITRETLEQSSPESGGDSVVAKYSLAWQELGHKAELVVMRSSHNVQYIQVSTWIKTTSTGQIVGLLGNGDHVHDYRDFKLPDGGYADIEVDGIYSFVNAWRVSDETSRFKYGAGESTATYTDMDFHENIPAQSYSDEQLQAAYAACSGVGDAGILSACVTDVLLTGDVSMASASSYAAGANNKRAPIIDDGETTSGGSSSSSSSSSSGTDYGLIFGIVGPTVGLGLMAVLVVAVVSVVAVFVVAHVRKTRRNARMSTKATVIFPPEGAAVPASFTLDSPQQEEFDVEQPVRVVTKTRTVSNVVVEALRTASNLVSSPEHPRNYSYMSACSGDERMVPLTADMLHNDDIVVDIAEVDIAEV